MKLVTVTNKEIIADLRAQSDIKLLYPLKSFCVGYELEFPIDEIDDYCLINRILEDKDLDELEILLKSSNIKGIVFDDLGVLDVIKDLNVKKILLLDHLATNLDSINYYLDYVDSVVVSNDLTREEIANIIKNAKKKLVVEVFGLKTLMYSRRTLLTNYEKHHNLDINKDIKANIAENHFIIMENQYGTKFYAYPYYNALEFLKMDNVLYYWYDLVKLSKQDIISIVLNNDITRIPNSPLFLEQKTFYKVGDKDE